MCTDKPFLKQIFIINLILSSVMELVAQAIAGDMRQVRHQYMKCWSAWKKATDTEALSPPQMYAAASKAWMECPVRAQILAARKNKQY